MEATILVPVVTLLHSSYLHTSAEMSKRLNRAISRAFQSLGPQRGRERQQLKGDTERSNDPPMPAEAQAKPSSAAALVLPAQSSSVSGSSSAAASTLSEASVEAPPAPPEPAEASPLITDDSLRAMLAESTEASVEHMMTSIIPYLTSMVRHQVQLSVAPPLQGDIRTQRRLKRAVGLDEVLAAVEPLPDALVDLPAKVGNLQTQLRFAQTEANAVRRSLALEIMARENAEQYLKTANAQVKLLHAEVKTLRETNAQNRVLLEKTKASTDQHTEELQLLQCQIDARDKFVEKLGRQLEEEREVFKAGIGANTEQTRQLHSLLVKLAKGKYINDDTLTALENQQAHNTHLLHVNRALRSHVSLAGMDSDVLAIAVQGMPLSTGMSTDRSMAKMALGARRFGTSSDKLRFLEGGIARFSCKRFR